MVENLIKGSAIQTLSIEQVRQSKISKREQDKAEAEYKEQGLDDTSLTDEQIIDIMLSSQADRAPHRCHS